MSGKHLTDDELYAEQLYADMFQAEVLLNDGERNAALWQTIPDTIARFIAHPHAPETVPAPSSTLLAVNRACGALVGPARTLDAYQSVTGSHLGRLAHDPYAPLKAEAAHRAVSQYAAALRAAATAADSLTRCLSQHRATLADQGRRNSTPGCGVVAAPPSCKDS